MDFWVKNYGTEGGGMGGGAMRPTPEFLQDVNVLKLRLDEVVGGYVAEDVGMGVRDGLLGEGRGGEVEEQKEG